MSKPQKPSLREAAEMAVDVLTNLGYDPVDLREALDQELQFVRDWNEGKVRRVLDGKVMGVAEQAEQEPVAWAHPVHRKAIHTYDLEQQPEWVQTDWKNGTPLYTHPVRTKDLTDDEILRAVGITDPQGCIKHSEFIGDARAVIAADREKNK